MMFIKNQMRLTDSKPLKQCGSGFPKVKTSSDLPVSYHQPLNYITGHILAYNLSTAFAICELLKLI